MKRSGAPAIFPRHQALQHEDEVMREARYYPRMVDIK